MEERSLPKNSNLKIKRKSLFRPHLQRGDFITPKCNGILPLLFYFYFYPYIQLFHRDVHSLHYCMVLLFLFLSSYSLISAQQLKDILKCKTEHVILLLSDFPSILESNPLRSYQNWSKFTSYYYLPRSFCSATWTFLLFYECMEHTSPCIERSSPNTCTACSLSTSGLFSKYPWPERLSLSAATMVFSIPLNSLYYFFVTLSQLYLIVICLISIPH